MKRSFAVPALTLSLFAAGGLALRADVRTDQRTKFQFAGAFGKVVNFFGGRAAREGVTSTIAVKGSRKIKMDESNGEIIDLAEEKVYSLDMKRKTYKVATFAEIRQQLEDAKRKAEEDARKQQSKTSNEPAQKSERDPNAKEVEVDFTIKNTGEKKVVNGFDTHESVATITVREKGKTLEQSGGLVMTTDMWLAPKNPALKEIQDFDLQYAQKVYGPVIAGASPQDMAAAMAMYPQMKDAIAKMNAEGAKVDGTPILTTVTMDAVKSADQVAEEAKNGGDSGSSGGAATPTNIGGLLGRMASRRAQSQQKADEPKDRATVLTTTVEVLKLTTDVPAETVAIPAGFKENK